MTYNSTHKRKVRGNPVHDDISKKKLKKLKKKKLRELEELNREEVEVTYLKPEIKNFVKTDQVKSIEERVKIWLTAGYPVHIIGPTGCGKTTIAMHIAMELGRPVVWINGDEQVTTTDLIGGYSQVEMESMKDKYIHNVFKSKDILKADWVDNPLTIACKHGYSLVYNEFSRTRAEANNILLSVLEEGILELPTKYGGDRYVKVHPDFNLILTSNSVEYAGVHRPQDALLDRTIGIYMDFYDFDTEVRIVESNTGIEVSKAKEIVRVIRDIRGKLPDAEKPGTRACIMAAEAMNASNGYANENMDQIYLDILATKVKSPEDLNLKRELVKEAIRT